MGIPKLIQTLQPFAERVIIGINDSNTQLISSDTTSIRPRVESVVIDGPSLVYHVYHRLLCLKAGQKDSAKSENTPRHTELSTIYPLLVQPSYLETNQSVLAFINFLTCQYGIEVQKIYFDGSLPASKRQVRLARLEDGRKKLLDFRQLQSHVGSHSRLLRRTTESVSSVFPSCISNGYHQTGERSPNAVMQETSAEALFQYPDPLPTRFTAMPAPPFMVPAVLQYLQSHLASQSATTTPSNSQSLPLRTAVVQLVPAEADAYCAAYARRTGAAILTSDSDLLAYDLGREGSVILLNSIGLSTLSEEGNSKQVLLGARYHGPSLTSNLGISCTLQRFCLHRFLDPTISTSELKVLCRKPLDSQLGSSMEGEWRRFLKQYSTDDVDCQQEGEAYNLITCGNKISSTQLQGLDPRIAELVIQLQHSKPCSSGSDTEDKGSESGETNGDEEHSMHMFLPLLVEDTSRDSAWSYGSSIRHLAYTILLHCMPRLPRHSAAKQRRTTRRIKEYQRRGIRILGLPIDVDLDPASHGTDPKIEKLLQSVHSHGQHFTSAQSQPRIETIPIASASRFWKAYALDLVSEQRLLNAKPPPNAGWAKRYLTPERVPYQPTSWDDVHNQATVEAVLYSLRLLKQIASLVARSTPSKPSEDGTEDGEGTKVSVKGLINILASLPPIEELMDPEKVAMSRPEEQEVNEGKKSEDERVPQPRDQDMMAVSTRPQEEDITNHDRLSSRVSSSLSPNSVNRTKRRKSNSASKHGKTTGQDSAAKNRRMAVGNRFAALEMHE